MIDMEETRRTANRNGEKGGIYSQEEENQGLKEENLRLKEDNEKLLDIIVQMKVTLNRLVNHYVTELKDH